jgi:hypothetical protein
MVTAKPENANAQLIMSMHKIALFMDVSTYCVFIFIHYQFQNKIMSLEFVDVIPAGESSHTRSILFP